MTYYLIKREHSGGESVFFGPSRPGGPPGGHAVLVVGCKNI